MTLTEMTKKILVMIEEYDKDEDGLTSDQDIETKLRDSINQVMFELATKKKIADYVEMEVKAGDLVRFEDIADVSDYEVYQIDRVRGAKYEFKANGTIIKVLADGILEIDYFRYPKRITDKTKENYVFELSQDVLEIMPYGVAADLLKNDVSVNYGKIYADRYEMMLQRLDPRYSMGSISVVGGVDI